MTTRSAMLRGLDCLRLEVPAAVANDVKLLVMAHVDALEARIASADAELGQLIRAADVDSGIAPVTAEELLRVREILQARTTPSGGVTPEGG